jgi:hypothetical protein
VLVSSVMTQTAPSPTIIVGVVPAVTIRTTSDVTRYNAGTYTDSQLANEHFWCPVGLFTTSEK